MPTTPSKEAQAAEGAARENATLPAIPAGETEVATATIGDTDPGPRDALPQAPNAQPDAPQPKMPTVRTMGDDKRAAITARFRQDRGIEAETDDADVLPDVTRNAGLPPEFQQLAEETPEPVEPIVEAAEPEPIPDELPETTHKYKVKVRGKEIEMTEDELIAQAQIALAADSYLDEAKAKLKSVEELAQRVGQSVVHPAAPNNAQPAPAPASPDPGTPPEDPFGKLLETMQFGDPEEAKALLRNTLGTMTQQIVEGSLQNARFKDEGARAAKVVKDFEEAHPELAQDEMARGAIEANLYTQQREDLEKIGVDLSKLRADGLPPTSGDIANAHRWFRVEQGMTSLRTPQQMLETAVTKFSEKFGGNAPPKPAVPGAPLPKATPKVDVTVDRTARRQAIPQQPSPTAAPRPAPAQPAPAPRDRSSIVQAMQRRNALRRGQSGVSA